MSRKSVWLSAEQKYMYDKICRKIGKKNIPGSFIQAFACFYNAYILKGLKTVRPKEIDPSLKAEIKEMPSPLEAEEQAGKLDNLELAMDQEQGLEEEHKKKRGRPRKEKTLSIPSRIPPVREEPEKLPEERKDPGFLTDPVDRPEIMGPDYPIPEFELTGDIEAPVDPDVDMEMMGIVQCERTRRRWEEFYRGKPGYFVGLGAVEQARIDSICLDSSLGCPECGARHVFLLMLRDDQYGYLYGCSICGAVLEKNLEEISPEQCLKRIMSESDWVDGLP